MTGPDQPSVPEQPQGQPPQQYPQAQAPYPGGYPPPPQQPYGGFAAPPPVGPKNGLGIAALVVAIVALLFVWSVIGGVIGGIVAIILGFLGRGRVKRGEATNGGVAIAGIVLGFLAIVVGLAFIAIYWAVFQDVGGEDFLDCLREAGNSQAAQQECADQFQRSIEDQFDVPMTPGSRP